jgi:hypothetical protein
LCQSCFIDSEKAWKLRDKTIASNVLYFQTLKRTSREQLPECSKRRRVEDTPILTARNSNAIEEVTPVNASPAKKIKTEDIKLEKPKHHCNDCGKQLSTAQALQNHRAIVHNNIKKFICKICQHPCSTRQNLQTHMNRHVE